MKTLRSFSLFLVAAAMAFGQATTAQTTISVAQDNVQNYITLTSSTGVVPASNSSAGTIIVVGRECETVTGTAITGTTFPVLRGTCGVITAHPILSVAWTAKSDSGAYISEDMDGRGGSLPVIQTLPVINLLNGKVYTCLQAGTQTTTNNCKWVPWSGTAQTSSLSAIHWYAGGYPPQATTSGTDTAGINGTVFISEVTVPASGTITGVSYLIGSVGGTDKAIAILFDSLGNVLATSAVAGTTVGTTATFQRLPFTTAYQATGPGLYFVGIQYNGTTAKLRTQVFGDHSVTSVSQTFGTAVAITPPTTFTTALGPVAMLY